MSSIKILLIYLIIHSAINISSAQNNKPPIRDPHTQGFVNAKELPDTEVPPTNENGNFIIGPTHPPAPEMVVNPDVPQGTMYNFT